MKLFVTIILSSALTFFSFHSLAEPQLTLPENTIKDIEVFGKKKLNEKTDLEELKKVLKTILILDNEDPSRTAVLMLSESYEKNKSLYEKALKSIENKKNKTQLKEIKYILKSHYLQGNG